MRRRIRTKKAKKGRRDTDRKAEGQGEEEEYSHTLLLRLLHVDNGCKVVQRLGARDVALEGDRDELNTAGEVFRRVGA